MRHAWIAALLLLAFAGFAAVAHSDNPPVVDPPTPRLLEAGPLVGYAGPDAVTIWACASTPTATVEVALGPASEGEPKQRRAPLLPLGAWRGARGARIGGLQPKTAYRYRVFVDGRSDEGTSGELTTPPDAGKPFQAVFAVVSCMNCKRFARQPAWVPLLAEKPSLLLQLGDSTYSNSTRPDVARGWYVAQRRVPEYADVIRTVPSLSIWDDHDFGANDTDGMLPGKDDSLATFREAFLNPACGLPDTPGVFFQSSYGDVDIFMLDGRYHRSPDAAPDDESKRMLGDAQFAWLERGLRASKATFKLVASGSTIAAGAKDSWRLYTRDRNRLYSITRQVPGVVFLSGDIHTSLIGRSEPQSAGYPIYEIVSSGVAVNYGTHFFVTMAVDTVAADPTLTVRVHKLDSSGAERDRDTRVIRRSELKPTF